MKLMVKIFFNRILTLFENLQSKLILNYNKISIEIGFSKRDLFFTIWQTNVKIFTGRRYLYI